MVEVEVLINNFIDKENYNKEITVIRNGKELKLQHKVLLAGDIYKISKTRYNILSKKGIVKKVNNTTKNKQENKED